MKTMKRFAARICALFVVLTVSLTALVPAAFAATKAQLPDLPSSQCVVDDANILSSSTKTAIENLNAQLTQQCEGAQIGVLTVDYTGSLSTEDYAVQAANTWGLGSSSKNNGVLILLVMQSQQYADGDYYLATGDGFRNTTLEKQASAIAQTMEDSFAAGDYDAAVTTCANNVASTIADLYGVTLSGTTGTVSNDNTDGYNNGNDYYEAPAASYQSPFLTLLAVVIVLNLSRIKRRSELFVLVLSGVIVKSMFDALVSFIKYIADPEDKLPTITMWLMGSLANVSYRDVLLCAAIEIPCLAVAMILRWKMNLLSLEQEEARSLGINVKKLRLAVILIATIMTAVTVSVCGIIGWIGLVIPHIARLLIGNDHRTLIPASALMGSIYLLLIDTAARAATAGEVPLSILTAMVGAPFFAVILRKTSGGRE